MAKKPEMIRKFDVLLASFRRWQDGLQGLLLDAYKVVADGDPDGEADSFFIHVFDKLDSDKRYESQTQKLAQYLTDLAGFQFIKVSGVRVFQFPQYDDANFRAAYDAMKSRAWYMYKRDNGWKLPELPEQIAATMAKLMAIGELTPEMVLRWAEERVNAAEGKITDKQTRNWIADGLAAGFLIQTDEGVRLVRE